MRGWDFSSLWTREDAVVAKHVACTAMRDRKPVLLTANGLNRYQDEVTLEMVLLPIRSSGERFDRLLGALSLITPLRWTSNYTLQGLEIDRCGLIGATDGETPSPLPARRYLSAGRYGAIEKQVHELIQGIRRLGMRHRDPSL